MGAREQLDRLSVQLSVRYTTVRGIFVATKTMPRSVGYSSQNYDSEHFKYAEITQTTWQSTLQITSYATSKSIAPLFAQQIKCHIASHAICFSFLEIIIKCAHTLKIRMEIFVLVFLSVVLDSSITIIYSI